MRAQGDPSGPGPGGTLGPSPSGPKVQVVKDYNYPGLLIFSDPDIMGGSVSPLYQKG